MTVAFVRKSESWTFSPQVSPLNSNQVAVDVEVRYLEPILPAGEVAPTDYTRVKVTLFEEKLPGCLVDEWMLKVLGVLLGGEG